jgi:hypothetical protein
VAGRRADAERQIATLKSMARKGASTAYQIALGYAGLGDAAQALDWLELAYRERSLWMAWLKVEPALDALRTNQRFLAIEKKVTGQTERLSLTCPQFPLRPRPRVLLV